MFGPVFRHEMLAAGRKGRFTVLRVVVGVALLAILAIIHESSSYLTTPSAGGGGVPIAFSAQLTSVFYSTFVWLSLVGVIAVTPAITAGAIASERERRTIEYLFATELSNREIVFDKLAARLLTVAQLVLATVGVLILFSLLGGVPSDLLLMHFGLFASAATLTAAISLCAGVWCDRAQQAVPLAFRYVCGWLFAPLLISLIAVLLQMIDRPWAEWAASNLMGPVLLVVYFVNPLMVLFTSGGVASGVLGVDANAGYLIGSIAAQFAAAGLFFWIAAANVRRVHLKQSGKGDPKSRPGAEKATRSPYDNRPMLWKEMFAAPVKKPTTHRVIKVIGALLAIVAIGGPLVGTLYLCLSDPSRYRFEDAYLPTAMIMTGAGGSILLLVAGNRAAGLVTYEKERDTWLTLLTTPLSASDIIIGKLQGNLYAMRWGGLAVVLIPLAGTIVWPSMLIAAALVAIALLVLGSTATAIGIWFSLNSKSSSKAIGWTTFLMFLFGAIATPILLTFFTLGGSYAGEGLMYVCVPPFVPFLVAAPLVALQEFSDSAPIYVSFAIGLIGYWVVAAMFTSAAIHRFDQYCGRLSDKPEMPPSGTHQAKSLS